MRVIHLLKTSVGARWAFHQMRELVRSNVDIHVALPAGGPLVADCVNAGIRVHYGQFDLPVRRPWLIPAVTRRLRMLVEHVQPDVVHSHFVGTTMSMRLALGRRHPTPRVFQVPGPLHLEHAVYRWAELATAGHADYWVASCKWTRTRYGQAGIPAARRFLVYYGTDIQALAEAAPGSLRAELGLAPATRIVGMIAYMYAPRRSLGQRAGLKGHEDLIDAVALCVRAGADVVCVMVGGAWNGADGYERRVRRYGALRLGARAVFLGSRPEAWRLYRDFDVAVHPSHSENVGGAAESLLMGVPTIATSVGGFPDVVTDGETGWLVPPRNVAALAAAILGRLADPEGSARAAVEGRRRAQQLLDVRENARQLKAVYETILAQQPAAALTGSAAI